MAPEGLIYPFMTEQFFCDVPVGEMEEYVISCDYGTVNPASFGLWGRRDGVWYRMDEYYYNSRLTGVQRTDEEHYEALCRLAGDRPIRTVLVDPSAASFITTIQRHGRFSVLPADNNVLDGIRLVSVALKQGEIRVCRCCADSIREFGLYRWKDDRARDVPLKENDHAMDDIRYFVTTWLHRETGGGFAIAMPRR